ncbi:unnamed protein product [Calypogeia fissa]
MSSTGRTVGEPLSTAQPENSLTTPLPTIVTRRDNSVQPEGLRTISQSTSVGDKSKILAKNTSNSSVQTRGQSKAAIGTSQNSTMREDCVSTMKNLKSVCSQDVGAVHVVPSKVLHEKQCSSGRALCRGEAADESAQCPWPARSAIDGLGLGLSRCDDGTGAESPLSARLFSDSENENPARIRRDEFSRHSLDPIPTPRAPMKPTRVKSLNTLFPGKTRRRLDFDHL